MKTYTCIAYSLRSYELFEKLLLASISEIIPKNKNILNIGANIDILRIVFSKIIKKTILYLIIIYLII